MINNLKDLSPILLALFATIFTYSVTLLGASLVFFFKNVKKNIMDAMLAIAAGVMIAASFFSLLNPATEMAINLKMIPWLITFIGFIAGGLLLFIGDKLFNHFDKRINKKEEKERNSFKRCLMLIFSITLHNIPEGLAVGVAFGSIAYSLEGATLTSAMLIALGIGIQNFPEGTAVSFAAGAMIYVVVEELIPESQTNKKKDLMSLFTIIGFTIMMILDIALG